MVTVPGVPLQSGTTGRFGATGIQSVRDATGQQLAGAGREIAQVGVNVIRYADQVQDELDAAQVTEADTAYSSAARKALTDPNGGYLNSLGKNALEGRKGILDNLERVRADLEQGLGNERQRRAFRSSSQARQVGIQSMIDRHASEQTRLYGLAQSKNLFQSLAKDGHVLWSLPPMPRSDSVKAQDANPETEKDQGYKTGGGFGDDGTFEKQDQQPQDPPKFRTGGGFGDEGAYEKPVVEPPPVVVDQGDVAWQAALQEVDRYAEMSGMPPAERDNLRKAVTSEMHSGRIGKMLDAGRSSEAKAMLDKAFGAGEMTVQDKERMQSQVERVTTAAEAESLADDLMNSGSGLAEMQEILQEKRRTGQITVEVFQEARKIVRQADYERREIRGREEIEAVEAAQLWAVQNRNDPKAVMDWKTAQALKDTNAQGKFDLWLAQGKQWITTERGYMTLLSVETMPETLRGKSWPEAAAGIRAELSDADFHRFAAAWARGNHVEKPEHTQILSTSERINEAMVVHGLLPNRVEPSSPGGKDARRAISYQVQAAIQTSLKGFELRAGRKATEDEIQEIIDKTLLDKAYVDLNWTTDPLVTIGMMTPEQRKVAYVDVGGEYIYLDQIPPRFAAEAQRQIAKDQAEAMGNPAAAPFIEAMIPTQSIAERWVRAGKPK